MRIVRKCFVHSTYTVSKRVLYILDYVSLCCSRFDDRELVDNLHARVAKVRIERAYAVRSLAEDGLAAAGMLQWRGREPSANRRWLADALAAVHVGDGDSRQYE